MTIDILQTLGQIAGIGGISLGVFLILFRDVIRKKIFPTLTKKQAFSLIRLFMILCFLLALAGLGTWVYIESSQNSVGEGGDVKEPKKTETILSSKANERIERLEQLVEILASRAASAQISPRAADEARKAESEIRDFIQKARNNPSLLNQSALDVALVVAHSKSIPGVIATHDGKRYSEFGLNSVLAPMIQKKLIDQGVTAKVFYRDGTKNFTSGIAAAATHDPSLIIELHTNGAMATASGTEALVRPDDKFGAKVARDIVDSISTSLGIKNRGVKLTKISNRGGKGLHLSTASTIILEPFFLTNPDDRKKALGDLERLASSIGDPIKKNIKQSNR